MVDVRDPGLLRFGLYVEQPVDLESITGVPYRGPSSCDYPPGTSPRSLTLV
jgi:hypothetical protein